MTQARELLEDAIQTAIVQTAAENGATVSEGHTTADGNGVHVHGYLSIKTIADAIEAALSHGKLEWEHSDKKTWRLHYNGKEIGKVWKYSADLWSWSMFDTGSTIEFREDESRAALEQAARSWLNLPPKEG